MLTSSLERLIGGASQLIALSSDLIQALGMLITAPTRLTSSLRRLIDKQGNDPHLSDRLRGTPLPITIR